MRIFPSKLNGFVTTPIVSAPISRAIFATTGAPPVPVPPPSPAVTKPFSFEGKIRTAQAEEGIEALRSEVDTLIVIPNDRLLAISDRSITAVDAFKSADQVLLSGVQGITEIITQPGLINLDFADVKTVMTGAGSDLPQDQVLQPTDRCLALDWHFLPMSLR